MGAEVTVRSQLLKVVEDLEAIRKASLGVSATLKGLGTDVAKEIDGQNKAVRDGLEKTQSLGRRVADQLRKDFASLFSVGSLTAGLKLSDQFAGSLKESTALSDSVRRFSSILGIAGNDFVSFQNKMIRGLGEIGAGSEAAANALKGLSESPVRGQKNLLEYAKVAAQLSSISGEKGQEGSIAKGIAGVVTARGGNANDLDQMRGVSQEILQIRQATGKGATEVIGMLAELYAKTNADYQRQLRGGGSTTLATAALVGGPQATAFLEKFMGMNRIERKGLEAQGFGNIIQQNGQLNTQAVIATLQEAKSRGLGDAQAGLRTYGFSDDEAQGFIRLAEAMKRSGEAINGARTSVVNLNDEYHKTMGLGDAFRANINRVKGIFAPAISAGTQGLSGVLSGASTSGIGAAAVTGSAAVLAAMLTGGGLRGLGKGLIGGLGDEAKAKAIEAATGEHVQKVEVINFPAGFGGVAGGAGLLAKAGGLALPALGVGAAAAAGVGVGTLLNEYGPTFNGKTSEGYEGGAIERLFFKLDKLLGGDSAKQVMAGQSAMGQDVRVKVELNKRDLKSTTRPSRGTSQ